MTRDARRRVVGEQGGCGREEQGCSEWREARSMQRRTCWAANSCTANVRPSADAYCAPTASGVMVAMGKISPPRTATEEIRKQIASQNCATCRSSEKIFTKWRSSGLFPQNCDTLCNIFSELRHFVNIFPELRRAQFWEKSCSVSQF